jgi:hypothetical protein
MKYRFKKLDDPIWFRLVDACPDELMVTEFIENLGAKLFVGEYDGIMRYDGIEFETEAAYTWFLLKI